MKRCPQCQFIYVDTDQVCDFDGGSLVSVTESELGLAPQRRPSSLWLVRVIAALVALVAGLVVIFAYHQGRQKISANANQLTVTSVATPEPTTTPLPLVGTMPSETPRPEVDDSENQPIQRSAISSGAVSKDPISTAGKVERGAATIYLQNGSRIEADEVWRTRQGIWYRKQGVVALIKANTVRSIQRR